MGCVRLGGLRELCDALDAPHLLQPTAEATREAIVAAGFDLDWLFQALPARVVPRLPIALGLHSRDLEPDGVADVAPRALALVEAGLALIRVLEPILASLPEAVRCHVARDLGAEPTDASPRSIAGALARSHTIDELLDALTPAERRRAGRAWGVEGEDAALRDALHELACPPEPRQHPPRVPEEGAGWLVLTTLLWSLREPTLQRLAKALGAPPGRWARDALEELEPPLEELVALLDEAELRHAWDEVGRLSLEPRPADDASAGDLRAWIVAIVDRPA